MPEVTMEAAENVMAIYIRQKKFSWYLDDTVQTDVDVEEIRARFLRPAALANVFGAVVARYKTATRRSVDVTAGQIMAHSIHRTNRGGRSMRRYESGSCSGLVT